ncbi:MAG: hypothetical protein ACOCTM_03555 [Bacteroidota bacterium]
MADVVGRIKAVLGLDDKKYKKGLDKARKKTSKFGQQLKKVGGLMAGAFAVGAITNYISKTSKAIVETKRMSDRLGVGVETMQELSYAAKQFGVSSDAMRDGLKELTMRVDEFAATGEGPASEVMKKLGITRGEAEKLKGNTEALFNTIVNKVSQVQNTASKQRIADELFGGQGGEQLVEMISSGTAELEKFRQEAQDIGYVIPEKEAARMEKFQQQMNKVGGALKGIGQQIITSLVPVIQELIDLWPAVRRGIVSTINYFIDLYNEAIVFRGAVEAIKFAFKYAWESIKFVAKNIVAIFENIGTLIKQVFTGQWDEIGNTVDKFVKDIGKNWADFGKNSARNFRDGVQNTLEREKVELIDSGDAEKQGKKAGEAAAKGVQEGMGQGRMKAPGKMEAASMTPFTTEKVEPQLKNMDKIVEKTGQMQSKFKAAQNQGNMFGGVLMRAFEGMSNSISDALNNSENALQGFWNFFKDFIQGLITKLIAAAAAAAALAALLSLTTGGGSLIGAGSATGFGEIFKAGFGQLSGFSMQSGGVVPPGYPNDSYPAMLTSGETVTPPDKLPRQGGGEKLTAEISDEGLKFILDRANRKQGNTL